MSSFHTNDLEAGYDYFSISILDRIIAALDVTAEMIGLTVGYFIRDCCGREEGCKEGSGDYTHHFAHKRDARDCRGIVLRTHRNSPAPHDAGGVCGSEEISLMN